MLSDLIVCPDVEQGFQLKPHCECGEERKEFLFTISGTGHVMNPLMITKKKKRLLNVDKKLCDVINGVQHRNG